MSTPAVTVEGLSYSIGKSRILSQLSFDIARGRFVSIIGPNGAGKTTLLRCLSRQVRTDEGCIEILSKPLSKYSQRELATVLSYVPQADGRRFPFTVFEFVLMGRYPHLSPFSSVRAEDKAKAEAALRMTGAEEFSERNIHTLSGGERQKVFIAAALAQEAHILLLDEPATFLDYRHQVEILGLLRRLNQEEGFTMVTVTHNVNSALAVSDEILALKEGALVFRGTGHELLEDGVLEDIYETPFQRMEQNGAGTPFVIPSGTVS